MNLNNISNINQNSPIKKKYNNNIKKAETVSTNNNSISLKKKNYLKLDNTVLNCPTPHINAKKGDFAKTVLLPGDPKRAEFIAKNFLTNAVEVNNVRGIQGYTGEYKGKKVSVMGSGMGIPSIGIYSYELYHGFDVENIIRVGSAGSMHPDLNVRDIVIATGACTDSNYGQTFHLNGTISAVASYDLLKKVEEAYKKVNCDKKIMFGQLFTTDVFYQDK